MSMTGKNKSIEQIIQQAIREGKFENLKGKGEPIEINFNPYVDPEWQLAYDMLSGEGFSLPWMEKRNEIERRFGQAKDTLENTWQWSQKKLDDESYTAEFVEIELENAIHLFKEKCAGINKQIQSYNLEIPSDKFFRMKINVERVIEGIQTNI